MVELHWRVFLQTKNPKTAGKLTKNIFELLGSCELTSSQLYWKDSSLFEITFKQSLKEKEPSKLMIEIFETASLISNSWLIDLPSSFKSEEFDLSGIVSEGIKITGLTWVSFMLNELDV
ncbi:MAG: hypothetical protein AAFR66_04915 [Bacteroidota bacterium]